MKEYSVDSGEAMDGAPADDDFAHLSVALITPSLTNPRKTFDATKLAELADSIKASGVHQPILVRPLPGSRVADTFGARNPNGTLLPRPTHELVAGERRYIGSERAGKQDIPCLIKEMTDTEAADIQLQENIQRKNLTQIEAA